MPIEIIVDEPRDLVIFRCSGELTSNDYLSALKEFYKRYLRPNTLWDLRESRLELTGQEIADLARMGTRLALEHKEQRRGGKTVAVAPRTLDYGMARMYENYAVESPVAFYVCRDYDEAIRFLDE